MALSGSYNYTVPNTKSYVALKINWTATQNIAANNSTVKTTIQIFRKAYGAIYSSSKKAYTLTVNGTKYTGSVSIAGGNNSSATLATATTTVAHGSNGAKTFGISFSINFGGVYWGSTGATINTVSCSSNFTLNTIARGSSFASVGNTTLGAKVPINITNHSSSFTQSVSANIGNTGIQTWTGLKGGAQSLTFNSSANTVLTNALTTATSVKITWKMSTFSGSTAIGGGASTTSTISLPTSELTPTVGTVVATEANANALKLFKGNSFVQGISQLKLSVSGSSATHGATIKSTTISFEGKNYSSGATTSVIVGSGTINAVATVTDSRGQQASKTLAVTATAYQPPQMQTAIAMRSNASGGFVSDGQYCTVAYKVAATNLPLQSGVNKLTLSIDSQEASASGWTHVKSIPSTTITAEGTKVLGSGYDGTKEYNIRLTASDAVGGKTQVTIGLDVAHVLMSWGKTQVGIGKVAQQGTLDVLGDQYIEGSLNVKNGNVGVTGNATVSGALSGATLSVGGQALSPTIISQLSQVGHLLWSGAAYMHATQTVTPSLSLNGCLNGWLLEWQLFVNGAPNNTDIMQTPIFKSVVNAHSGRGFSIDIGIYRDTPVRKYLYPTLTSIKGAGFNNTGISYNFVLTSIYAF